MNTGTNQQKFKELLHKEKYRCEDCGGTGGCQHESHFIGTTDSHSCDGACELCNGKGYIVPLEFGCELERNGRIVTVLSRKHRLTDKIGRLEHLVSSDDYGYETLDVNREWKKLGKPPTLQEILWLLGKSRENNENSDGWYTLDDTGRLSGCMLSKLDLPLNKDPKDYGEDVYKKLLELIN